MLDFVTLDVFTTEVFTGNPLAVVLGADGLTTAQMQTIAREFNLSETIFVMAPRDPAHTARVRIFFPTAEIPFAGHPTVGCAIHLATTAAGAGDFTRHLVLEEEAGLVPVTVTRKGDVTEAEFAAPVLPHATEGTVRPELLAPSLGLDPDDIGFGGHQPAVWQGGPRFLYVPLRSVDALARARVIQPYWDQLAAATGTDLVYLYTAADDCAFRARLFAAHSGIAEDPATGSASAILAAQLQAAGALNGAESRFHLRQGVEMGRASDIHLTVLRDGDRISQVRIKGAAVPVSTGRIVVPVA